MNSYFQVFHLLFRFTIAERHCRSVQVEWVQMLFYVDLKSVFEGAFLFSETVH